MKIYKNLKSALAERDKVEAIKLTLEGDFPQELFYFNNIKELYLEGSCAAFPKIGMNWLGLKLLSLKCHSFNGDISGIFYLPSLENLKIIETPLASFLLPLGFAPAPLQSLTIKSCGLKQLPEEISMLPRLKEINLSGNELISLPHSTVDLVNLQRLNLDSNKFQLFPDLIGKMKKLTHLSIDGNLFSQEEKDRIQRNFHLTVH